MSLTLFHLESDQLLMSESMAPLKLWLQMFDQFNGIAPGVDKEDMDDMSWPGSARYKSQSHRRDTGQFISDYVFLSSFELGLEPTFYHKLFLILQNFPKVHAIWSYKQRC
jgi:hypothetical protein